MAILGEKHKFWFEAIKNDDDAAVKCVLKSPISDVEKDKFLNGKFQLCEDVSISTAGMQERFTRPFILAAVFGSLRVCDVMIQNGVDVFSKEAKKCNVFHCLVRAALFNRKQEAYIVSTFQKLCRILPNTVLFDLLKEEQENGLRPLEFAAQQRMFKLMSVILDVPNMILIKEEIIGISVYRWYDVTEYLFPKPNSRHLVSPLAFLAKIDKDDLHSKFIRTILSRGIMSIWSHRTLMSKRLGFYCMAFVHLVFFTVLFFTRDNLAWLNQVTRIVEDVQYPVLSINSTSANALCTDAELYSYSAASDYLMQSYLLLNVALLGGIALISLIRVCVRYKRFDSKMSNPDDRTQSLRSVWPNIVRYIVAIEFFAYVTTELHNCKQFYSQT